MRLTALFLLMKHLDIRGLGPNIYVMVKMPHND